MTSTLTRPMTVTTDDGLTLTGYEIPGADNAVTVVYLHGLLADSEFWHPVIKTAAAHTGTRVRHIAIDARGHGGSDRPPRHADTDLVRLADDLACVIDQIPGPIVLVAHSAGTYTVLEYARLHPQQMARIDEVVLFAAAAEQPWWPAIKPLQRATAVLRWMRRRGPLDTINATGHRLLAARLHGQGVRARPDNRPGPRRPVDPRATADICTAVSRFRIPEPALNRLAGTPLRLVAAEYDRVVPPAQTRQLADRLPHAVVDQVLAAGHSLPLTDPTRAMRPVLAAVERFLPLSPEFGEAVAAATVGASR